MVLLTLTHHRNLVRGFKTGSNSFAVEEKNKQEEKSKPHVGAGPENVRSINVRCRSGCLRTYVRREPGMIYAFYPQFLWIRLATVFHALLVLRCELPPDGVNRGEGGGGRGEGGG